MKQFLRNNGLTIVLLLASALTILGMLLSGWQVENEDLRRHGQASLPLLSYMGSGAFLSALFENWESEFLQMSAYVVLTAYLYQKGSAESKDPDEDEKEQEEAPMGRGKKRPAVGAGRWLYEHSLGLVLAALFVVSFVLHLVGSARAESNEAAMHGDAGATLLDHIASAQFWFESFQNWQSEFLSTAVIVVLSIFLRYRGSPESKPVDAPDSQTGS
ncbi:DUF6766 family protein [Gellertiella hungarica]|uniref:Membrane protein implicated in regulation of membrane protease activity n=1 Tax=Gellertiella hungarica TaxID=1572859 RepID=A0A7W6NJ18_9HYPH|nr:DUF6766 family protein [Gellertiella hungarica]MBB4063890.1 membrane protein implicated in regulation of membrane protease activity [Gellertiella hungarica]